MGAGEALPLSACWGQRMRRTRKAVVLSERGEAADAVRTPPRPGSCSCDGWLLDVAADSAWRLEVRDGFDGRGGVEARAGGGGTVAAAPAVVMAAAAAVRAGNDAGSSS